MLLHIQGLAISSVHGNACVLDVRVGLSRQIHAGGPVQPFSSCALDEVWQILDRAFWAWLPRSVYSRFRPKYQDGRINSGPEKEYFLVLA